METGYNLFLDDSRVPAKIKWMELPLVEWAVVRNYEQFVSTILQRGLPTIVSFDHDLHEEHYKEFFRAFDKDSGDKKIRYDKLTEKTGYDCAKWLAQYCVDNHLPIPLYYLHTLNGIGAANIAAVLESARKVIDGTA